MVERRRSSTQAVSRQTSSRGSQFGNDDIPSGRRSSRGSTLGGASQAPEKSGFFAMQFNPLSCYCLMGPGGQRGFDQDELELSRGSDDEAIADLRPENSIMDGKRPGPIIEDVDEIESDAHVHQREELKHAMEGLHPLASAVLNGRIVAAHRQLSKMLEDADSSSEFLDEPAVKRIRDVGDRFYASLDDLKASGDGWMHEGGEHGVSIRLVDRRLEATSSFDIRGFDALRVFVGLCEYDLSEHFMKDMRSYPKDDVMSAELLNSPDTTPSRPEESLWRIRKHPSHLAYSWLEDNIVQVSCVDALEEANAGFLWFQEKNPDLRAGGEEEDATEFNGLPIPAKDENHIRTRFAARTIAVEPRRPSGASPQCRILISIHTQLPKNASSLMSIAPEMVLRPIARAELESVMTDMKTFLHRYDRELSERMLHSTFAPFYEQVRRHLSLKGFESQGLSLHEGLKREDEHHKKGGKTLAPAGKRKQRHDQGDAWM